MLMLKFCFFFTSLLFICTINYFANVSTSLFRFLREIEFFHFFSQFFWINCCLQNVKKCIAFCFQFTFFLLHLCIPCLMLWSTSSSKQRYTVSPPFWLSCYIPNKMSTESALYDKWFSSYSILANLSWFGLISTARSVFWCILIPFGSILWKKWSTK